MDKMKKTIPPTQAAYQPDRSTTEQVFSMKILAEKAITSADYKVVLLLLDMSKGFDTVRRKDLFDILKEILDDDELHMIKILVEDVKLTVRVGNSLGEKIITNIGVPQGDCLSPILFIIHLAAALKPTLNIGLLKAIRDHDYGKYTISPFIIDQQYADDTGWITSDTERSREIRREVPPKLKEKNLMVNDTKTEEHEVERNGSIEWMKCKYLGSLLDTENDIKRRKTLAHGAFNNLKHIFESKRVTVEVKLRLFRSHVESIFLYNSELWTLTKSLENTVDVFQRNILRKILNTRWPDKIRNEDLYEKKCKVREWSKITKERRLRWYGHLLRLPASTPAKKALENVISRERVKRQRLHLGLLLNCSNY
eukprot:gene8266-biopygen6685